MERLALDEKALAGMQSVEEGDLPGPDTSDPGLDPHPIIVPGRGPDAQAGFGDGESDPPGLDGGVAQATVPHELRTTHLEPGQVPTVVDHAHLIGIGEVHPKVGDATHPGQIPLLRLHGSHATTGSPGLKPPTTSRYTGHVDVRNSGGHTSMNLRAVLGVLTLLLLGLPAAALALEPGDVLPSMTLEDLDGERHDLSAKSGYVLVIYFTGFSCASCVDAAAALETDFVTPYRGDRVEVFAVDSWGGLPDEVTRFRDAAGVRYPFLLDGGDYLAACDLEWQSFVVVDGDGIVRYVNEVVSSGVYDGAAMQAVVDQYLSEAVETEIVTWGEIKNFYDPDRRDGRRSVATWSR